MRELVVTATSEAGRAAVRVHEPEQDPQRGLLPAPFGPRKPVTWPASSANDRSETACTPPKRLLMPSISIAATAGRGTLEGVLDVLQRDDAPGRVEGDPDDVEARLVGAPPAAAVVEPLAGHAPDLGPLSRADRGEWPEGAGRPAGHTRLHLAEDEAICVSRHQVELSEAGAEVAVEDLVAERGETVGGQALAEGAETSAEVFGHHARS
jgi:hypothetical protein